MDEHKRIGDYEILNELGSGGMGRVFRVRNVLSDRIEAMKVLLPDLMGREDLAARFLREIKVLAALNHPNIASLRTALTIDNQLVMIMEYVEGQSLAARLQDGPIAVDDALNYFDQALEALAYAHAQGVIHRDVKPANMLLMPQGIVKLTDFGIARAAGDHTLTVVGSTTGSLSYMPPEQVNGEATDARSDVYSAGISLYEMVTGRTPFKADSGFGVMLAHLKEQPRPPVEVTPGLPAAVNDAILKAIAKNPADRFQSAHEFRDVLRALSVARRNAAGSSATVLVPPAGLPSNATTRIAGAEIRGGPSPRTSDYQRTVLDTAVPTGSGGSAARAVVPPPPAAQLKKGLHPAIFMVLGATLVIAAVVGTGVYLRQAEAGSDRAEEAAQSAATSGSAPGADARTEPAASSVNPAPQTAGPAMPPPPAPTPASPDDATPQAGQDHAAAISPDTATTGRPPAPPAASPSPRAPERRAPARAADSARPPAAEPPSTKPDPPREEPQPPAPAPQDSAGLDELEDELDQLSVRAAAINSSLDRLQQEQARQGLGLRGDIVARQESMKLNLARAEEAVEKGDAARARKYKDQVERDVQTLEKFLGR